MRRVWALKGILRAAPHSWGFRRFTKNISREITWSAETPSSEATYSFKRAARERAPAEKQRHKVGLTIRGELLGFTERSI